MASQGRCQSHSGELFTFIASYSSYVHLPPFLHLQLEFLLYFPRIFPPIAFHSPAVRHLLVFLQYILLLLLLLFLFFLLFLLFLFLLLLLFQLLLFSLHFFVLLFPLLLFLLLLLF